MIFRLCLIFLRCFKKLLIFTGYRLNSMEILRIKRWPIRCTMKISFDTCNEHSLDRIRFDCFFINPNTASNKNIFNIRLICSLNCVRKAVHKYDIRIVRIRQCRIAADDDIQTIGQWFRKCFVSFSADNNRILFVCIGFARCNETKEFQIVFNVPGNVLSRPIPLLSSKATTMVNGFEFIDESLEKKRRKISILKNKIMSLFRNLARRMKWICKCVLIGYFSWPIGWRIGSA